MKQVFGYVVLAVAVGGMFWAWETDKVGMAYEVKSANHMEAPCGEGYYYEDDRLFDKVGDVIIKPFETHKCK